MMADLVGCPGEEMIVALAHGALDDESLSRLEAHAATCASCRERLTAVIVAQTQSLGTGAFEPAARLALARDGGPTRGAQVGRYVVLERLGEGAMGAVYAAYDPELDRKVALKLLHADGGPRRERTQARFLREAKALAKLSHGNVVVVHDAGTFSGRVFIAMEFVDGQTLQAWLDERPRSRAEILRVFVAAGRGLVAAHEAGLIHRDFKPSNVMIGRDGSVRLGDFGLARAFGEEGGAPGAELSPEVAARDPAATTTNELIGTPRYMAPEQFLASPTDARSDQFSFCVALYRALYGAPPFAGDNVGAIMSSVLAGRIEAPPPSATVPTWLRRVVTRGLSRAPDARWPSMAELLGALEHDPAVTHRRRALAVVALAAVAGSAFVVARRAPSCTGGPSRLAAAWEGSEASGARRRRAAVENAFLASGAPGALDVWTRVTALLDRYRADWLTMYRDACEATEVRREQSPAMLDLRMSCLDEARVALSSLTDALTTADREVVGRAVDAARALPPVERCGDLRQLRATIEPPRDEATRKKVDDLRRRAAVTKALHDTGRHAAAGDLASAQLEEARAIGYQPLVAEALMTLARTVSSYGHRSGVGAILKEAVWTSLAVGRDDLVGEAASYLVDQLHAYDPAGNPDLWVHLANAAIDRAGPGHELLRAWVMQSESANATYVGDDERSLERAQAALALKEKLLGPDHPDDAVSLQAVTEALCALGRTEEALALNRRVLDLFTRAYGPASIEVASTLSNEAEYLVAVGRPAEAIAPATKAVELWQAQRGAEHSDVAYPLTELGHALWAVGRAKDALPPLERALRLREPAAVVAPPLLAETQFLLARALWDAGGDRRRPLALATAARAAYAEGGPRKRAAEVDVWLGERARSSRRQ
jgi:tetratricopeptide (TPR) repeat protein